MALDFDIPIPRQWPRQVKSAFLQSISFASTAFTCACGLAAKRKDKMKRLQAELAQTYREMALLKKEMQLKDERFRRLLPHRRPYYRPIQRMQILQLKAARCWSTSQTAKAFLLNEHTVISWMQRIDEEGENALLQLTEPVNKFPAFVRYLVRQLKTFIPALGKEKIAQVLARAGLHLGVTTVGRMIKEEPSKIVEEEIGVPEEVEPEIVRVITAKYPGHLVHCDLTVVPTSAGIWVPWFPFSIPQVWPFCWWIAVVIDHFSRSVIGFAVYRKKPTSLYVRSFLGRTFQKTGKTPKHIIMDKDSIFFCDAFRKWCKRKNVKPRYGAVGRYGSVSVIERFIKSMKNEGTRNIIVPLSFDTMRRELSYYVYWFNQYRPHTYLKGKTPKEAYDGIAPANSKPRYEPRSRWPRGSPCAAPQAKFKGKRGSKLVLVIGFFPVIL
jgi:transposase InsO family protein